MGSLGPGRILAGAGVLGGVLQVPPLGAESWGRVGINTEWLFHVLLCVVWMKLGSFCLGIICSKKRVAG